MKTASTFSIVFLLTVWPLLLTLVGCGNDPTIGRDSWSNEPVVQVGFDPSERVQDIWIAEHGMPHAYCTSAVESQTILPVQDAHTVCGEGTAGCTRGSTSYIDIRYEDSSDLKTHELLHVMINCQLGYADRDHTDSVWLHLPVNWSNQ